MKCIYKSIFLIICLFTLFVSVNATCDEDSLNKWAEKLEIKLVQVTDSYLEENGYTEDQIPYSYILMLNVPRNDLRVTAKDTYSKGTYNVEYDNDFKNFVVGSEIHFVAKTYVFNIYMSEGAEKCSSEKMKTITYTVPAYNSYNDTVYCEENPNSKICGAYTEVNEKDKATNDDIIDRYYQDKIEEEIYKTSPWYTKIWKTITNYYLYVLIPFAIIGSVYTIIIYITKKRSERK